MQPGEHEVLLSFFEIIPPRLGPNATESEVNAIKEGGVVAECIARITIAKERFPGFAMAMQEIADFLLKEKQQAEKSNADS